MRNIKLQAPWHPLLRTGGRKDVRSRYYQKFLGYLETKFGYEARKLAWLAFAFLRQSKVNVNAFSFSVILVNFAVANFNYGLRTSLSLLFV